MELTKRRDYDVYLSGPITAGTPEEQVANIVYFARWAEVLRKRGLRVFSPPESEPLGMEWEDYLRRDIAYLVNSEVVALLPGWEESRGAKLERMIAIELNIPVWPIEKLWEKVSIVQGLQYQPLGVLLHG